MDKNANSKNDKFSQPKNKSKKKNQSSSSLSMYSLILLCFYWLLVFVCIGSFVFLIFVWKKKNLLLNDHCNIPDWKQPSCRRSSSSYSNNNNDNDENGTMGNSNITMGIPSKEWWDYVRQAYTEAVGKNSSTIRMPSTSLSLSKNRTLLLDDDNDDDSTKDYHGFLVPGIEARISSLHGRGIFTKFPIKKGTKIWENDYTARFSSECEAKRFFSMLQNNEVCDILSWGYPTGIYTNYERYEFAVELDITAFTNDGGSTDDVNVFTDHNDNYSMYASRDIEANTELLLDYKEDLGISFHPQVWWFITMIVKSHGFDPHWLFQHFI